MKHVGIVKTTVSLLGYISIVIGIVTGFYSYFILKPKWVAVSNLEPKTTPRPMSVCPSISAKIADEISGASAPNAVNRPRLSSENPKRAIVNQLSKLT